MKNRELVFVVITVLLLSCLTMAGPGDTAPKQRDLYPHFETFSRIVNNVTAHYVEEVEPEKLFYGAYDGMLATLDPYSAFLPPEEKEDLEVETKGEFGGLGIEITLDKHGVLTVVTPLEDSPAFRAGVLAGDRIVKIEEKSTKGITLRDAVKKLRGPKGKPVTITVLHENGKYEDITVVRDIIKLESVKAPHFVDETHKIAYIRLAQFQANSAESLDKTIADLRKQGMKALVLDLRFNPGGLLSAAIEVADRFLDQGTIVSTKDRHGRGRVFRSKQAGTYPEFPLALLISSRTASASEIVSGAVQDHKRGVLVGMRTFGKGSVQSVIKLEDGKSAIRLTTAYYYTPSGRLIHRDLNDPDQKTWGIDPDIQVKVTFEDEIDLWNHWRQQRMDDIKERNGQPDDQTKPDAPKPEAEKPEDEGKEGEAPKEFHDRGLEAALNALKGILIARERAAAAAAPGDQPAD
jgi:carboxyl-terminal processing protease